jgi:hypothetical protein
MVRANRYALAAAMGGAALHPAVRALHGCNNTACVRVSRPGETGLLHIVSGSQRHNMEMMARARRGGGRPQVLRGRGGLLGRRSRAVALRDAVKGGWDGAAVRHALWVRPISRCGEAAAAGGEDVNGRAVARNRPGCVRGSRARPVVG